MDKASRLFITEIGTAVSHRELSSLLPTSVLRIPSETGNTILQLLYSVSVPLGKRSPHFSLFPFLHLILFVPFYPVALL